MPPALETDSPTKFYDAVVIGGSSGSMDILKKIIPALRQDLGAAVMVVTHVHPGSGDFMAKHLDELSQVHVRQAEDKDVIEGGVVYMAPPDYHLLVEWNKTIALSTDAAVNYSRPSIDVLFESAADVYADRLVGIVLSGANTDGSAGLKFIRDKGGLAIVQNPASAEMDMMPQSALAATSVDYVLDPHEIIHFLNRIDR
jgi:two-component system, chemotaxis family, protein-glutamate methylesterase/glutaminase